MDLLAKRFVLAHLDRAMAVERTYRAKTPTAVTRASISLTAMLAVLPSVVLTGNGPINNPSPGDRTGHGGNGEGVDPPERSMGLVTDLHVWQQQRNEQWRRARYNLDYLAWTLFPPAMAVEGGIPGDVINRKRFDCSEDRRTTAAIVGSAAAKAILKRRSDHLQRALATTRTGMSDTDYHTDCDFKTNGVLTPPRRFQLFVLDCLRHDVLESKSFPAASKWISRRALQALQICFDNFMIGILAGAESLVRFRPFVSEHSGVLVGHDIHVAATFQGFDFDISPSLDTPERVASSQEPTLQARGLTAAEVDKIYPWDHQAAGTGFRTRTDSGERLVDIRGSVWSQSLGLNDAGDVPAANAKVLHNGAGCDSELELLTLKKFAAAVGVAVPGRFSIDPAQFAEAANAGACMSLGGGRPCGITQAGATALQAIIEGGLRSRLLQASVIASDDAAVVANLVGLDPARIPEETYAAAGIDLSAELDSKDPGAQIIGALRAVHRQVCTVSDLGAPYSSVYQAPANDMDRLRKRCAILGPMIVVDHFQRVQKLRRPLK